MYNNTFISSKQDNFIQQHASIKSRIDCEFWLGVYYRLLISCSAVLWACFSNFRGKRKFTMQNCQFKVIYTQFVCRESPRKTAKDGTPILLKTCCFNDMEQKILDLPEACRWRTVHRVMMIYPRVTYRCKGCDPVTTSDSSESPSYSSSVINFIWRWSFVTFVLIAFQWCNWLYSNNVMTTGTEKWHILFTF